MTFMLFLWCFFCGVLFGVVSSVPGKVGIPNFVSGPREYIMEGEYVILAMCSWFRIS